MIRHWAAIVALHLKAAGAKVTFSTVIGRDKLGKNVLKELKKTLQKKIGLTKTTTGKGFTLEKLLRDFKPIVYKQKKKAVKKKKLTLVSKSDALSVASSVKKPKKKGKKLKLTKN